MELIEDKKRFYNEIYYLFNNTTPLPVDCGDLCGGLCCTGDDDTGMLLFPGEELLFEGLDGFEVKDTEFKLSNGFFVKLLICEKSCKRELRPLACRIFPLFGIRKSNEIKVVIDPRSYCICPLAQVGFDEGFTTKFILAVSNAFIMLIKDNQCKEFIDLMKDELLLEE